MLRLCIYTITTIHYKRMSKMTEKQCRNCEDLHISRDWYDCIDCRSKELYEKEGRDPYGREGFTDSLYGNKICPFYKEKKYDDLPDE